MKQRSSKQSLLKKISIWGVAICLVLLVPLVSGMPWTLRDYIFAGVVLSGCALFYELVTRNMKGKKPRMIAGGAVVFFILLVMAWAAS